MFRKGLKLWLKMGRVRYNKNNLLTYGIVPLAYLTAKAHGLDEFANTLEESLRTMDGVDADQVTH
jgi:hypothetical protein